MVDYTKDEKLFNIHKAACDKDLRDCNRCLELFILAQRARQARFGSKRAWGSSFQKVERAARGFAEATKDMPIVVHHRPEPPVPPELGEILNDLENGDRTEEFVFATSNGRYVVLQQGEEVDTNSAGRRYIKTKRGFVRWIEE